MHDLGHDFWHEGARKKKKYSIIFNTRETTKKNNFIYEKKHRKHDFDYEGNHSKQYSSKI